ncbi:MAG: helix-turn-helix domain-containing protein [Thermoleophilia bacterium]
MRSARIIREARLRAGLTQAELAERSGRDRTVVARWEQGLVAPSVDTLVELVRACGFELPLEIVPLDDTNETQLKNAARTPPDRRLDAMLDRLRQGT